jgi:glycosyltransferase involved in cell wall biosynthesis
MTRGRVVLGIRGEAPVPVRKTVESLARQLHDAGFVVSFMISGDCDPAIGAGGFERKQIPEGRADSLSDAWLSAVRHLEENAPCVYISNQDWLTARITVRLSNRVTVIGVLHENLHEEYENCAQLGRAWNAVVALDPSIRQRVIGGQPAHAARLARLPEESSRRDLGTLFTEVIETCRRESDRGRFRRIPGKMDVPPAGLTPRSTREQVASEAARVNAVLPWPDPLRSIAARRARAEARPSLREHRIILSVPTGRVSGVDVFSMNLARSLRSRGYDAEILQTAPDQMVDDRVPMPADVPVTALATNGSATWPHRWSVLRRHLADRAPCVFVPNYDVRYSCVAPALPDEVRIVGIAHSDDPQHYDHIVRLAPYWDAVVAVSATIGRCVAELVPDLEHRLVTVPYGVVLPSPAEGSARDDGGTLRVAYSGRITRLQKRAQDLPLIARGLADREVDARISIIGSGSDRDVLDGVPGNVRSHGTMANAEVLGLLSNSDVVLLTSSFEGFPVSIIEAMAHGCVPIVTDIRSGVPELVRNGDNGFVVPVGDAAKFVDRIACLAVDRERLARMRASALETARSYDIERVTDAYIDVFGAAIADLSVRPTGSIVSPPVLGPSAAWAPLLPAPLRKAISRAVAKLR